MTNYMIGKYSGVEDAYVNMSTLFDQFAQIQPSRNGETKEMHPFFYTIDNFSQYMLTVKGRVINFPFALAEILWIMLGDNTLWIADYNKQMGEYANDGLFNAAYGHRMRSNFYDIDAVDEFKDPPIDQFEEVINFLKDDHASRHAVIVYRDPVKDRSEKDTKDRACNISSMFLIRNGLLNLTQTVRSHDFIWGVPYNFIQFGYITQALAERLEVGVGSSAWLSNSLHVYDKHYGELEGIGFNNELGIKFDMSIPKIGEIDYFNVRLMQEKSKYEVKDGFADSILTRFIGDIRRIFQASPFWSDGLLVLLAYWLKDNKKQCLRVLNEVDSHLFRLMTLRYFYHYSKSWKKVLDDKDSLASEYMSHSWQWNFDEVLAWLK